MLAWVWLFLLLAKGNGICYEECKFPDALSCSRCLSTKSLAERSQSLLICNVWDNSECWMGWYKIKISQESIKIEFLSEQKEINIKFSQESKNLSAEFLLRAEEKQLKIVNCPSSNLQDGWQSLGLAIKLGETENPLSIWLLGNFFENQNFFKGFIYIDIAIEAASPEISCAKIPDPAKEDCKNCAKSCAPWLLQDSCTHEKRNLCSGYTYKGQTLDGCPTGTIESNCMCSYPGGEVFNIVLDKIVDPVIDSIYSKKVSVGNTGGVFYPNYDSNDPIPAYNRGYYFTGSSYMKLPPNDVDSTASIFLAPDWSISLWVLFLSPPSLGTRVGILSKLDQNSISLFYLYFDDVGLSLHVSSVDMPFDSLDYSQWLNIGVWCEFDDTNVITSIFALYGSHPSSGGPVSFPYFQDSVANGNIFIGKGGVDSNGMTFNSLFQTFIYSIRIWNSAQNPTAFDRETTGCASPCSTCPLSRKCLAVKEIDKYYDSGTSSWLTCLAECSSLGCVRNDKSCNLCKSQFCKTCNNWDTCIDCIPNSNSATAPCTSCASGYSWDSVNEVCSVCTFYCSSCISGKYLIAGVCSTFCPLGYTANSATNNCDAKSSTVAFNLVMSSLSGLITESSNSLKVITGSSSAFYPSYDSNDPKAAYLRGYYFNGQTSLLHLAPFSTYTTPLLVLGPQMTIQAWINPSSDGNLLSKVDSSFANIFKFSLSGLTPKISIKLHSSGQRSFSCANSLTASSWNHIGIAMNLDSTGHTVIYCIVNSASDSSNTDFGVDYFIDTTSGFYSTIGALQTSSSSYSSYYTGFIYKILIDNLYSSATSDYQTSLCSGGCQICPAASSTCLPICTIDQYWSGGTYNTCSSCNSNCLTQGCREDGPICNLCSDIRCSVCSDYSAVCTTCLANASLDPNNQCMCNIGYYWDTINQVCAVCDSNCKTCSGSTNIDCTSCTDGFYLDNNACASCNPPCATCSGQNSCLSCSNQAISPSSDGQCSCKENEYQSSPSPLECGPCHSTCLTCVGPSAGQCLSCKDLSIQLTTQPFWCNKTSDGQSSSTLSSAIKTSGTIASAGLLVSGFIKSIVTGKSGAWWTYVNMIQLLSFIPLQNIDIPDNLSEFWRAFTSYAYLHNTGKYIFGENKRKELEPIHSFYRYGYTSSSFLVNGTGMLLFASPTVALFILIYSLSFIPIRSVRPKLHKLLGKFKFNIFLKLWIQTYILLMVAAVIGMNHFSFQTHRTIIDSILAYCFFISGWIVNFFIIFLLFKKQYQIYLKSKKTTEKYGCLFEEFEITDHYRELLYYPWFLFRRLFFVIILYDLSYFPIIQWLANVLISLLSVVLLIKCCRFKDEETHKANVWGEILVTFSILLTGPYIWDIPSTLDAIIQTIIYCSTYLYFLQAYYYLLIRMWKIMRKKLKEKKSKTNSVSPDNLAVQIGASEDNAYCGNLKQGLESQDKSLLGVSH